MPSKKITKHHVLAGLKGRITCTNGAHYPLKIIIKLKLNEKSAQRDANTARALPEVRCGHRPPVANTATHPQTGPITIHCAAKLSAQCKN